MSMVLAISLLLWRDVLHPTASKLLQSTAPTRSICLILQSSGSVPPELCTRTVFSIASGGTAACLCIGAVVIHACTRCGAAQVIQDESSYSPILSIHTHDFQGSTISLRTECILSVGLSILLGFNAVVATAVQGPAATVGNLYCSSWVSLLLCLRICMGCLEEAYNLGKKELEQVSSSRSIPHLSRSAASDAPSISPDLFDNE